MVKPVNEHDESAINVEHEPGVETEASLSDGALLDLLDALVDQQGRVPAARVLGVNYRTLSYCCDSRQVSRRMRRALVEFRDASGDGGGEARNGVDGAPLAANVDALRQRAAEQENENAELRELADGQACQLEELAGRLAELEDDRQSGDAAGVVDVDTDANDATSHEQGDGPDWKPPRRRPGMPDAGVVTLEEAARRGTRLRPGGAVGGRVAAVANGQRPERQSRRPGAGRRAPVGAGSRDAGRISPDPAAGYLPAGR